MLSHGKHKAGQDGGMWMANSITTLLKHCGCFPCESLGCHSTKK